jgi:hypothetical protein
MTSISLEVPVVGAKNTTEEPKVGNSIKKTEEFINGANLDGTTNIKAEGIAEANLTAAVQTKLNQKSSGLELKKQAGSATGESGILYLMETNAATLTLTATATASKQVGIICNNGIESVKLKAGVGAKIFGDFVLSTGAGEVTVRENQHLIVEADGTNWRIIAGEPTNTNEYTTLESLAQATVEAGVTPSKTRPTLVTLSIQLQENHGIEIKVAGKAVAKIATGAPMPTITQAISFRVGANQAFTGKLITTWPNSIEYAFVGV